MDRHGRSVATARAGESVVLALAPVAGGDLETVRYVPRVTPCHARVTPCHAVSRRVTPCHSVSRRIASPLPSLRLGPSAWRRRRAHPGPTAAQPLPVPTLRARAARIARVPHRVTAVTDSYGSHGSHGQSRQFRRTVTAVTGCSYRGSPAGLDPCNAMPASLDGCARRSLPLMPVGRGPPPQYGTLKPPPSPPGGGGRRAEGHVRPSGRLARRLRRNELVVRSASSVCNGCQRL